MELRFRKLRADEIDCRISSCSAKGVVLLLYKDARCDQNVLDETVGPYNWQRHHSRDNANCVVAIWDKDKEQWIEKEDTGKESYTEKEKGLASDSFKRACFNWGIGRELYTAPFMFVGNRDLDTLEQKNGKWTCRDTFNVTEIEYDEDKIARVQIVNTRTGVVHNFKGSIATEDTAAGKEKTSPKAAVNNKSDAPQAEPAPRQMISKPQIDTLIARASRDGVELNKIMFLYKVGSLEALSARQFGDIFNHWEDIKAV